MTKFDIITRSVIAVSSFGFKQYGDYVLITTKTNTKANNIVGVKQCDNGSKVSHWYNCVTKAYFDEQVALHGNDPTWIAELGSKNSIEEAISPKFLINYIENHHDDINTPKYSSEPLETLLKKGKFELFVRSTGSSDTLYDLFGKPVWRKFKVSSSYITNDTYKMKQTVQHLSTRSNVEDAKIVDIPSYNASANRNKAVTFTFVPTQEQFDKLIVLGYNWQQEVIKMLNLEQFKKIDDDE